MTRIFHPLLALIASATDRELAKYVQFLKEENKILRSRVKGQIHTKPAERERLLKFGIALGRAVEELITIVSPKTYYRWMRDRQNKKPTPSGVSTQRITRMHVSRKPRDMVTRVEESHAHDVFPRSSTTRLS
jgi:putative transposase